MFKVLTNLLSLSAFVKPPTATVRPASRRQRLRRASVAEVIQTFL